jgi:ribonuclease J
VRRFNDGSLLNASIDTIEVEPLSVDHSIPGVCGFILHTSNGSIGYTADLRFHGRRTSESENLLQRCGNSAIIIISMSWCRNKGL